jgi:hypothetical protein
LIFNLLRRVKSKALFLHTKIKMLFLHLNMESRSFPISTT